MSASVITVSLAETELNLRFNINETEAFFENYRRENEVKNQESISVTVKEIREYMDENKCNEQWAEYCLLRLPVGNALTHKGRMIFHGVSFIYGNSAYILTAPSGTGKTTQFRNLKFLFKEKYRIINGDKPVLSMDKNKKIQVWPSPWNGKERWSGWEHAPLKGIILLSQGIDNILSKASGAETALRLMEQVLFSAPDQTSVKTVCTYIDVMLREIPLYHFVNRGDEASSRMLNDLICRLEKNYEL